jgi:hypothetical protein
MINRINYLQNEKKNKHEYAQKIWYIVFCAGLILLVSLDHFKIVSIPNFIFLAFSSIYFLTADKEYYIPALCILIPFSIWISLYYVFGIVLGIFFIKFRKLKITTGIACIFLVMLIELLSFIHGSFSIYEWIRLSVFYAAPVILFYNLLDKSNVNIAIYSFIIGYVVVCVISLINVISIINFVTLIKGYRFGSDGLRGIIEPLGIKIMQENELAIFSVVVFSMALLLLKHKKNLRIYLLFICGFSLFMTLLSLSRTGILLLVLSIIIYGFNNGKSLNKTIVTLMVTCIVIILCYTFLSMYIPQLVESIAIRFHAADISNGRIGIFNEYFVKMFSNIEFILLGVGAQDYVTKLNMYQSSHNALQQVFVMWGIAGLVLIICMYTDMIKFVRRSMEGIRIPFLYYLPFMVLIIGIQIGQFDNKFFLFIPTLYSVLLAKKP